VILQGSSPDGVGAASYVSSPDGTLLGSTPQSVLSVGQPESSGVVSLPSPVGVLEGRLDPALGPLVSLPTYVVGGGGGGGGSRPRIFHIDDYGADPTGVAESNQALIDAYNALGSQPGVIVFGVGTYKLFVGLNAVAGRVLRPQQAVVGQGSGQTVIDYRGPGACLEFRNLAFDTSSSKPAGGAHGLTILGWNSGENNSCGIRYGDIWRMRVTDVEISGFNRPGCKGLWGDNQYRWSERGHIECVVNQCTECFVFESNTGDVGFPTGSFDYSQYWLSFVVQPNQHAFVLRSGTAGSQVSMNGASVTLTGNCQLASSGGNTGVMFRVGKDNVDGASFSGELQIGVETSGSSGVAHFDFMQGTGSFWEVQSRVTATGSINLIPFSGARFQAGNATPRTFAFGGLLKGSPALGGTSTVQSFQSLQVVSQARGGWFLSQTHEVQTVYVTEATGGTFTLSYGGNTTSALPHNATPAAVQSALNALPSIAGAVTVYSAQARFVNSVALNEIGFTVLFGGALGSSGLPAITSSSSLTGASPYVTVVEKVPGSPNPTYVIYLEGGSIFMMEPPPGTYRLRLDVGGLTSYGTPLLGGDSPFGLNVVDVWIKQPDSGGAAVFEGPFFVPAFDSGSTYDFKWMDGQDPILSSAPGAVDIIRLTSYNFSKWVGQHLTRLSTTTVPVPATSSSPGVKGQIAHDANYIYTCVATNSWKRSPLSTW
jgi:hypothetical protein